MVTDLAISSNVTNLSCSSCGTTFSPEGINQLSRCCSMPLLVNYNTNLGWAKTELSGRENTMWRYLDLLPLNDLKNLVTLGEGMTPIISLENLATKYGFKELLLKDEGLNPTGSFKARGMSMAISKAKELGIEECVVPTAGNAGGAMSAYCATANIKATILMPSITPHIYQKECKMYGAKVILVDGLIDKCGDLANELEKNTGIFNMATLKEPYRLEGKKTMGYEIAEQLNWQLPDIILYPTGGGTGLIGIWKAFHEMIELGWIEEKLPRMIAVQSANCSPVVDFTNGIDVDTANYSGSVAGGLAVPKVLGIQMISQVLQESNGRAVGVDENAILPSMNEVICEEGIAIAPEGGAIWAALKDLYSVGSITQDDKILLLNTGSGYKSI